MKHGSLFSGIGGFDYAASIMGWENVFHCEWNTFGQQVLKYHFPNSICHDDITKTDFSIYRGRIDIISGGFPCQPYSMAGKRLGKDDERHLWPEMLRAIREISPKWIVGENVFGIVNWSGGLVFEEVQADLEREGYEVQSYILPAAGVDAPHKRDRVFFIAYRDFCTSESSGKGFETKKNRSENNFQSKIRRKKAEQRFGCDKFLWNGTIQNSNNQKKFNASNTNGMGLEYGKNSGEMGRGQSEMGGEGCEPTNAVKTNGEVTDASNTSVESGRWELQQRQKQGESGGCNSKVTDASDTDCQRFKKLNNAGQSIKQGGQSYKAISSLEGTWQNFPTQSPVCFGNDGISSRLDSTSISFPKWRNESIKAAGNAVVPQVILQIFKAIQDYENLNFC